MQRLRNNETFYNATIKAPSSAVYRTSGLQTTLCETTVRVQSKRQKQMTTLVLVLLRAYFGYVYNDIDIVWQDRSYHCILGNVEQYRPGR